MAEMITEAMVKGTAIAYEGHFVKTELIREVLSDGTVKEKTSKKNKLRTVVVNLEDFYPSTIFAGSISELTGAAWRETLSRDSFIVKYGEFKKAEFIPAFNTVRSDDFPAYRDDANVDINDGSVEVIHIYKKDTDEYIILANGFWLNVIDVANKQIVSPIPFKHKELPFFMLKFEHIASNFLYGKSMPDKLRESQDMLNVMTNMTFDQSVMALWSPIITTSQDYIEDDFLRPGRRIALNVPHGQRIDDVIKELKISPPSGWYQFILQYTKNIIEESSVDALSSGSASGLPDRTTARAVEIAAAGVVSTLTYFGLQIREAIKGKHDYELEIFYKYILIKRIHLLQKLLGKQLNILILHLTNFLLIGQDCHQIRMERYVEEEVLFKYIKTNQRCQQVKTLKNLQYMKR
jgi:hypothetical protein